MTRNQLTLLFLSILALMLLVTIRASVHQSILSVGPEVTRNPWFHATLADAYLGFLTVFAWAAYKERTALSRIIWFVLFMTLGNIAMSIYILVQIAKADREGGIAAILLRSEGQEP